MKRLKIKDKDLRKIFLICFLVFSALFLAQKINLATADIGRHIKNGEIFFKTGEIIDINYYSYSEPNYSTPNHHWFSGVIFYLVYKMASFKGLSLFYIGLGVLTLYFVFIEAEKRSNWKISLFLLFISLPLFATRTEIRPEVISYLFLAIYLKIFDKYRDKKIPIKTFFILSLLQILWINSHIYWVFGYFVLGIYTIYKLIFLKNKRIFWNAILLDLILALLSLINPFGYKAVIEPFMIFREFGYLLVENMSVFFLQKRFGGFKFAWIEFLSVGWIVGLVANLVVNKNNLKELFFNFIFSLVFIFLSFKMMRNFPIWMILFVLTGSSIINDLINRTMNNRKTLINQIAILGSTLLLLIGIITRNNFFSPFSRNFGIGLLPNMMKSIEFFKIKNIKGPIINNYDVGGYLIYGLSDIERVFVDNRPEAYSLDFFDKYKQINEVSVWRELNEKYGFNSIYFYRHDLTPWGQEFLVNRISDWENWSPIFIDDYVIIMVARNELNAKLIETYELPREIFSIN